MGQSKNKRKGSLCKDEPFLKYVSEDLKLNSYSHLLISWDRFQGISKKDINDRTI